MNAVELKEIQNVCLVIGDIVDTNYDKWIGREVDYCSKSGKHYRAIVSSIPENPKHGYSDLPAVRLIFENRDRPGKFIKKERVIPRDESIGWVRGTWAPLEDGRQLWEKREDGKTYFCD
jgi:hypothetical protein